MLIGIQAPGAFAELVRVPAASARVLPDGVSFRTGALVEPLANGVHAVRLGLAREPVERAVVLGGGTIGLVTLQAALLSGIEEVALLEPQPRAARARRRASAPTLTYGSEEEALAGRARRPRARRGRRAGHARARHAARAPGRAGRLRRPRRRRHHARLPRHRPQPADAPGLLRVHDGRLRAGVRVARERPGLARRAAARCARSRTGPARSPRWRPARRPPP